MYAFLLTIISSKTMTGLSARKASATSIRLLDIPKNTVLILFLTFIRPQASHSITTQKMKADSLTVPNIRSVFTAFGRKLQDATAQ